jgi:hypothetical protein
MEKVGDVIGVALGAADHHLLPGRGPRPHAVRPDIPVGVFVALVPLRCLEPGMLVGGVAGDEVEHHADAEPARLGEQRAQVVIGTVARRDLVEIGDIVAGVAEGRLETRIQPDAGDAEVVQVGQFFHDAAQVADAVAVRVAERLRINFVEDRVFEPCGHVG